MIDRSEWWTGTPENDIIHFRGSVSSAERKMRHWEDMAHRHIRKCEDCAEISRSRSGYGCSKYHDMMTKAEPHKRTLRYARGRLKAAEEAVRLKEALNARGE